MPLYYPRHDKTEPELKVLPHPLSLQPTTPHQPLLNITPRKSSKSNSKSTALSPSRNRSASHKHQQHAITPENLSQLASEYLNISEYLDRDEKSEDIVMGVGNEGCEKSVEVTRRKLEQWDKWWRSTGGQ